LGVIEGMIMDLSTFGESAEDVKSFRTNTELETYLGWIGGEPGRFWTNLLLHHGLFPHSASRERVLDHGIAFGKGLQMVNILKDLPDDLARGRCYLPEERLRKFGLTPQDLAANQKLELFFTLYHQLINETVRRLENGLYYLGQLNRFDWRLKAAVWWPLSIGLKTLAQLRLSTDVLRKESRRKVERKDIYKTMASSVLLPSEKGLRWEFERLAQPILG
jgi:farnesyl-diphosphate farnesyltransferase